MKNVTTNPFGYKFGESTENNKVLLFFPAKETIQTFNGSFEAITLLFSKRQTSGLPCLKILQRSILKLSRDLIRQSDRTFYIMVSFLSDFVEITSCVYTKTIILVNIGE